jgi:hypothetical protein
MACSGGWQPTHAGAQWGRHQGWSQRQWSDHRHPRDRDPLGSGELLFQVMGDDGLLLLPSEGGGALKRPCLVQGLACSSHGSDESLLLSMRGSDVILLPLGGGGGLLPIDGGEVGVVA